MYIFRKKRKFLNDLSWRDVLTNILHNRHPLHHRPRPVYEHHNYDENVEVVFARPADDAPRVTGQEGRIVNNGGVYVMDPSMYMLYNGSLSTAYIVSDMPVPTGFEGSVSSRPEQRQETTSSPILDDDLFEIKENDFSTNNR